MLSQIQGSLTLNKILGVKNTRSSKEGSNNAETDESQAIQKLIL